ncbi:MAG: DUF309 domain-containing protein [Desulfurobacteriaceae bacterium]
MDLFEIRNWFAHNLVDYLREKEEESLRKLNVLIEIVDGKSPEVVEYLREELLSEFPLLKLENGFLTLNEELLDPFTKEYLEEKSEKYKDFLKTLGDFEPVHDDIEKNIHMARKLFKSGLYFEVHELLEELWFNEFGKYREFIQALIQIAVAYYHLQNFNVKGYELLIQNAIELLKGYEGVLFSVDVDKLKKDLANATQDELVEF